MEESTLERIPVPIAQLSAEVLLCAVAVWPVDPTLNGNLNWGLVHLSDTRRKTLGYRDTLRILHPKTDERRVLWLDLQPIRFECGLVTSVGNIPTGVSAGQLTYPNMISSWQ